MAPAWMFGRIGCFMAHDHIGTPSTFPLAVNFPGGPRHDLGLYEAILMAFLSMLMYAMRDVRGRGVMAGTLMATYSFARFWFDFLRIGDSKYFGLTPAQYGTFVLAAFGIWLVVRGRRELVNDPEAAMLRTVTEPATS
jgi:phosphatidylglycerol:prolipoprotein diacylglycerol transferase